jgi:hypothetical protein
VRRSSPTVQREARSNVTSAHQLLAFAIMAITVALLATCLWSWLAARRSGGEQDHRFAVDRLVLLVEAVVAVQIGIGGLLVATGDRPSDPLHLLYGVAALATLPVGWAWGGRPDRTGAVSRRHRDGWLLIATGILLGVELRLLATG